MSNDNQQIEQCKKIFQQGNEYFEKQEYGKAIEYYSEAIEILESIMPQNDNSIKMNLAKFYANRGYAYIESENYDKGFQDCNRAIELDPNHAQAYNNRGRVYSNKAEFNKAIQDYNKAIVLNPNFAEAYNNIGTILNDINMAMLYFNKAIELNPNFANAYYNRGITYFYKNEFDKAILDYNKTIQLNENYIKAYINRGITFLEIKEFDKAIQNFNKAIELNPNYTNNYYNRGNTYLYKEEYDNALKDFNYIINELKNNDIEAYYKRGIVYNKKEEYDNALKDFNYIINELKNNDKLNNKNIIINAYRMIGLSHILNNDYSLAYANLQNSINNDAQSIYTYFDLISFLINKQKSNKLNDLIKILYDNIEKINDTHVEITAIIKSIKNNPQYNSNMDKALLLVLKIAILLRINENKEITRYMSVKGFDKLYKNYQTNKKEGSLRLYSASLMNDTTEGDILHKYLFNEYFHNKVDDNAFIASFTQNDNDAMQMWQTTYGDNCKGISYSFNTGDNALSNLDYSMNSYNNNITDNIRNNINYSVGYYRVAYYNRSNKQFRVYEQDLMHEKLVFNEYISDTVTKYLIDLKSKIKNDINDIKPALLFISHLVKDITWNYENEVRVIQVLPDEHQSDKVKIDEFNNKSYYDTEQAIKPKEVVLSPKYNPARLYNNNQHVEKLKEKNINFFYLKSDEHNISKKDDRNEFFSSAITTVRISDHIYNFGTEEQEYMLLKEELNEK